MGMCTREDKSIAYNISSLHSCPAFTFRSCPGIFRVQQNVMPKILQMQFTNILETLIHSSVCGTISIHTLKQSLNIILGKMKDKD